MKMSAADSGYEFCLDSRISARCAPRGGRSEDRRVSSLNLASGADPRTQSRRRGWLVGTVSNPPRAVPHVTSLLASSRTSEHISKTAVDF